jgi:hypothetical protein
MGFFDMLGKAFDNDENISQKDTRSGMIDGASDTEAEPLNSQTTLTATQEKWRQQQVDNTAITAERIEECTVQLDLFLAGIPNKDPSNDLFGSRVSISARDRTLGLDLPEKPTVADLELKFLPDFKCICVDKQNTGFMLKGNEVGEWILSEDGKQVRFRIDVAGYTRRVETKGTIQKVFWSDEDEKTSEAATIYNIPPGWLYGEAELSRSPKQLIQWENGVLKVEESMGLLGSASKMTPCGKFDARTVVPSSS